MRIVFNQNALTKVQVGIRGQSIIGYTMKQSPSPLWTVTFYLTLSAICVAVHGWNRRNAEAAIAGEDDDMMVAKNELLTMNQNDLNSNDNSKMDEGNEKCFLIGLDGKFGFFIAHNACAYNAIESYKFGTVSEKMI